MRDSDGARDKVILVTFIPLAVSCQLIQYTASESVIRIRIIPLIEQQKRLRKGTFTWDFESKTTA